MRHLDDNSVPGTAPSFDDEQDRLDKHEEEDMEETETKEEKRVTVHRMVQNIFTVEDMAERGAIMANMDVEIADKATAIKKTTDKLKRELADMELSRSDLSQKLRDGFEAQNVECHFSYDYSNGTRFTVRTDTGEEIEETAISEEEKQIGLGLPESEDGDGTEKDDFDPVNDPVPGKEEAPQKPVEGFEVGDDSCGTACKSNEDGTCVNEYIADCEDRTVVK